MIELNFSEIYEKLESEALAIDVDLVVGIAKGGLVPAAILAGLLKKDVKVLWPNKPFEDNLEGIRVLLVDDFSRTGSTIEKAKKTLKEKGASDIQTLVVAGKNAIFPSEECVMLPWREAMGKEVMGKNGV